MTELVSAPIFVFITGTAEVLIVVFVAIILAYGVLVAKNIKDLSGIAKKETAKIVRDIEAARDDIKSGVEFTKKRIGLVAGALSAQRVLSAIINGASGAIKKSARRKTKRPAEKGE